MPTQVDSEAGATNDGDARGSAQPARSFSQRRSTDARIGRALDLGWRVAALYGFATFYEKAELPPGLLPTAASLEPRDRLELDLSAAACEASRLGVGFERARLRRLHTLAHAADSGQDARAEFRDALWHGHVWLDKSLWTEDEKEGRAYELGVMLFDTWGRIRRAYEPGLASDRARAVVDEWREVFGGGRVRYLFTLLDDLQSRLDPGAVIVVRDNLESWQQQVAKRLSHGALPQMERPWEEVESQVLAWRQLLTGDKEPEAYIGAKKRAKVRDELMKLMWRRYWLWIVATALVVAGAVFVGLIFGDTISSWYADHTQLATLVTGGAVSLAGVLGISKASIVRATRESLQRWSELLWNRALMGVVCRATLRVGNVFPPPTRRQRAVSAVSQAWNRGVRTPSRRLRHVHLWQRLKPSR